ncbi:hypothetical protein G6F57_000366 [Rhizopus arrhizus]|uniref:Probable RNA-binding protein 18 n=1 Tax=Rhizopus oryzae TaxID=64495 RepID=A0A9P7BVU7_RHIOR|nr:hypothetical protein G6F30_009241 [Rhizopus arrhizus]KAG1415425.1 hypothetical protein G6F58_006490 [Rhizopus delemar]KAG0978184.1 hypothetical protein G6F29_009511 [Rhizopus arrhizus]KAG0996644.1 hypothetical protein G6F28_003658 [Rhizopus arrhizus]KAG1010589.1 hypothetical protein G6F27_004517 [Rhizopus arrhizus]
MFKNNNNLQSTTTTTNTKRLYIGNLANVIDEYTIVKLFEPFGKITYIDSLIHWSGPKKGLPRGYCFLEYETKEQALKAINSLHGKTIKGKSIVVSFAHMASTNKDDRRNPHLLNRQKLMQQSSCTDAKIKAIEQKLQLLKKQKQQPSSTTTNENTEKLSRNQRYKPY